MKNKTPSPDDLSLWQQAMRDVKRLFGAADPGGDSGEPAADSGRIPDAFARPLLRTPPRSVAYTPLEVSPGLAAPPASAARQNPGIDRRTEERFRKGQMTIDGRIDLHGLTLKEAHALVRGYIQMQHQAGKRCLLVITGKGSGPSLSDAPSGQIRQSLPHWLDAPDLRALILSVAPARRGHGGDGAFYVLLRRSRD